MSDRSFVSPATRSGDVAAKATVLPSELSAASHPPVAACDPSEAHADPYGGPGHEIPDEDVLRLVRVAGSTRSALQLSNAR